MSVLPKGMAANVIEAFEDKPMYYDAWDIDIYLEKSLTAASSGGMYWKTAQPCCNRL